MFYRGKARPREPKKVFWKPKKKKNRITSDNENEPTEKKPKKPRIQYGGLTSEDEDISPIRRTRGKKINYLEALGSSDDVCKKKKHTKNQYREFKIIFFRNRINRNQILL